MARDGRGNLDAHARLGRVPQHPTPLVQYGSHVRAVVDRTGRVLAHERQAEEQELIRDMIAPPRREELMVKLAVERPQEVQRARERTARVRGRWHGAGHDRERRGRRRRPRQKGEDRARFRDRVSVQKDERISFRPGKDRVEGLALALPLGLHDDLDASVLFRDRARTLHRTVRATAHDHPDRRPPGGSYLLGHQRPNRCLDRRLLVVSDDSPHELQGALHNRQQCAVLAWDPS